MRYDDRRADAYDSRYADRFAEAEATADFLAGVERPAGPVLELGVGTGRVALPLARRGVDVHGIDASTEMVERLRSKPGADQVTVAIGDFGAPDLLVEGPFGLVYVVFNTLFALESQERQVRCFEGVAGLLAPGGLFAVEAFAMDLSRLDQTLTVASVDSERARLQATSHDPFTQLVTGQTITISSSGIELWPFEFRYATLPEQDLMARVAGLRLRERWGSWGREPFSAGSERYVSVYERPA